MVAALAAWSARETYRVRMEDLGNPNARPVDKPSYAHLRGESLAKAKAVA